MNSLETDELIIPLDKRIYVIEDIDDVDENVVSRISDNNYVNKTMIQDDFTEDIIDRDNKQGKEEKLNLGTILNVLDGILEIPGRVILISTNHPERLDPALIRPGRMDMVLEFTKCNTSMYTDIIQQFYNDFIYDDDEYNDEHNDDEHNDDEYNDDEHNDRLIDRFYDSVQYIPEYKWTPAEVHQMCFKYMDRPLKAIESLIYQDPLEFHAQLDFTNFVIDDDNNDDDDNNNNNNDNEFELDTNDELADEINTDDDDNNNNDNEFEVDTNDELADEINTDDDDDAVDDKPTIQYNIDGYATGYTENIMPHDIVDHSGNKLSTDELMKHIPNDPNKYSDNGYATGYATGYTGYDMPKELVSSYIIPNIENE